MYNIKVSSEQIEYAENLPAPEGQNEFTKGQAQLTGKIGEVVICDELGHKRPKYNTFDGGYDVVINGKAVDVKTISRNTDREVKDYYTHNIRARQIPLETDYYIFCSYSLPIKTLTVCGYIHKDIFKHLALFCKKGTVRTRGDGTTFETYCDTYEIRQSFLQPINSQYDFQKIGA